MYYGNQPQQPMMGQVYPANFNADSIILELNNASSAVMNGTADVFHVRDKVLTMIREGKLRMIGGGQNRVAVELTPDDSKYKAMLGINGPMILMVPVKLPAGIKDNQRAAWGYQQVFNQGLNNSPYMVKIRQTYLPSVLIPNTMILAQKRITRIEDSKAVKLLLQQRASQNGLTPVDADKYLGSACRDLLLENPAIYQQYVDLITAYDKHFVMADLNPEFSPWNFGFDIEANGQEVLKILDYGYLTYKDKPNLCPHCGKELRYCIPGEAFLRDEKNRALANQVGSFGQYSCKNPQCSHRQNGRIAPYIEPDISVFLRYTEQR